MKTLGVWRISLLELTEHEILAWIVVKLFADTLSDSCSIFPCKFFAFSQMINYVLGADNMTGNWQLAKHSRAHTYISNVTYVTYECISKVRERDG